MTDVVSMLVNGDVSFFAGDTASRATGWLTNPERFGGAWLRDTAARLPRRHEHTIVLGMGGSSGPSRLYAEAKGNTTLTVLDTTHPDTVSSLDYAHANVIAASKSGSTIETQTALAHALAHGLDPADLVIITDPGTTLEELGHSLGATVILGNPETGGRFSALSPFGLVPALYVGWDVDSLQAELDAAVVTPALAQRAWDDAQALLATAHGMPTFPLGADPISNGGALWLEQLVGETTGKNDVGVVPVVGGAPRDFSPRETQYYHLLAALLAYGLGVDPFNQPNVESAKKEVLTLLGGDVVWDAPTVDLAELRSALADASYLTIQAFVPQSASPAVSTLREQLAAVTAVSTANLGPRYLHSTGQLHKGGPRGNVSLQIVQRPSTPVGRIAGRRYSFHDLVMAQAIGDYRAIAADGRAVYQFIVDDVADVATVLGLPS